MVSNTYITINNSEIDFYAEIEKSVIEANLSYIESITNWVEKRDIEIENIASFIKKNQGLKNKIQAEAETLKLLKRTIRLPL